ncbi:9045_t:CDS:2, partial [Racocetra persica]
MAFGAFGGSLKNFIATELGAFAASAAIASFKKKVPINSVFFENILQTDNTAPYLAHHVDFNSVFFGNVLQTDNTAPYLARHVGLRPGLPIKIPVLTINRLCRSGFQAVINAVQEIGLDFKYWYRKYKFGLDLKLEDSLVACLVDQYPTRTPMDVTAENLPKKITLLVNKLITDAAGCFSDEITPVEVKTKKSTALFSRDEHPRSQTIIQTLSKLPFVFVKNTGVVMVDNESGISDGAGAIIVASEDTIKKHRIVSLAQIVSYSVTGVKPTIIGIGPILAIKEALKRANLKLSDIGL